MNILYLSCHAVLAYDECKLFQEMGHYVFCPDSFVEKIDASDTSIRPKIEIKPEHIERFREDMAIFHSCGKPGINNKELITVDFFKRFDVVIHMHDLWVEPNWQRMKKAGIPMVLRTIGQSVYSNEKRMAPFKQHGLKTVRYSPREEKVPNYNGSDAFIRFYKDPSEYSGWTGENKQVVTVAQSMQRREPACNYKHFEFVTQPFTRKLYGAESESLPFGMGKVSMDDLYKIFKQNRVYFYTGTYPASYTLNGIEAMMTGIPMVCIGPKLGHPHAWFAGHDLYEMGDIIVHGKNGFISDNVDELRKSIKLLLDNEELAKEISAAGRETAIKLFGKENICKQWEEFLNTLK